MTRGRAATVDPHPLLAVDHRPAGAEADRQGDDDHEGGGQQDAERGNEDIEPPPAELPSGGSLPWHGMGVWIGMGSWCIAHVRIGPKRTPILPRLRDSGGAARRRAKRDLTFPGDRSNRPFHGPYPAPQCT